MEEQESPELRTFVFGCSSTVCKELKSLRHVSVTAIAIGQEHSVAASADGDVYTWGRRPASSAPVTVGTSEWSYTTERRTSPTPMRALSMRRALEGSRITAIACAASHAIAASQDGVVYTWGSGKDGQLGLGYATTTAREPAPLKALAHFRIMMVACGASHCLAATPDGRLFAWGLGLNGRLGLGAGSSGEIVPIPQRVPALADSTIVQLDAGFAHSVAVDDRGIVFTWGRGVDGQLGHGELRDELEPRPIADLCRAVGPCLRIACGYYHCIAVCSTGSDIVEDQLVHWGIGAATTGSMGGSGAAEPASSPVLLERGAIPGRAKMTHVAAGAYHSAILDDQGSLYTVGNGDCGQLGHGNRESCHTPQHVEYLTPYWVRTVACGKDSTVACAATRSANGCAASGTSLSSATDMLYTVTSGPKSETTSITEAGLPNTAPEMDPKEKDFWFRQVAPHWESARKLPRLRTRWLKGLPPAARARLWPLSIGNDLNMTPEVYRIYRRRAELARASSSEKDGDSRVPSAGAKRSLAAIDVDLARTFSRLALFARGGPFTTTLQEVLDALALFRPDLGYVQGMSYLGGVLVLVLPDSYTAFVALANLCLRDELFPFYRLGKGAPWRHFSCFQNALSAILPHVAQHFDEISITPDMYLVEWMLTLFAKVLPFDVLCRVWDCYFLDHTPFLFRVALGLIKSMDSELCRSDLGECVYLLRHVEEHVAEIGGDALFECIFSISLPESILQEIDSLLFYSRTDFCCE